MGTQQQRNHRRRRRAGKGHKILDASVWPRNDGLRRITFPDRPPRQEPGNKHQELVNRLWPYLCEMNDLRYYEKLHQLLRDMPQEDRATKLQVYARRAFQAGRAHSAVNSYEDSWKIPAWFELEHLRWCNAGNQMAVMAQYREEMLKEKEAAAVRPS